MIAWSRVAELRDEVGVDDFDEVVDLFLEEVEEVINRLRGGDVSQLASDMHFLRGSAMSLGFATFSEHCHVAERLAANGRAGEVNIADILATYDESKRAFIEELPAHSAS